MLERSDKVYLVVTVLKTKNSYRLFKSRPRLNPNEFCYAFKVTIDMKEWFGRIEEVDLGKVTPPNLPKPEGLELIVEKDIGLRVVDRLLGRDKTSK